MLNIKQASVFDILRCRISVHKEITTFVLCCYFPSLE